MRVRVNVKEMGIKDRLADLDVTVWGENLHAPLIERLLELPMDIYGGVCHAITWHMPSSCCCYHTVVQLIKLLLELQRCVQSLLADPPELVTRRK